MPDTTRRAPKPTHLKYGWIVYSPLIAAGVWTANLIGLLVLWATNDYYRIIAGRGLVVYISDLGATWKTFFIVMNCCTVGFYLPAIFAQRWLRAVDRIPEALRRRETVFGWLTIVFGIIGSAGLITLGIMDDVNHGTVHWSMTVVFVVGIAISAVAQTCEVSCLATDHPDRAHLRRNGILKLIIVGLAVACAITFGGLQGSCQGDIHPADHPDRDCYNITSAAASFEWATAFLVVFYFLTLSLDLWPAAKTSPRFLRKMAKWEEDHLSKAESHLIADLHEPSNQPTGNYFSDRSDYDHAYDTENAYPMRQHSPPSMEQPNHPYAGFKIKDTLKTGWFIAQAAFEPYIVASGAFFIPLALEQLAKDNAASDGRIAFLGWRVESASYSLYIGSLSVFIQALAVISLGTAADNVTHRLHLLTTAAIVGSLACISFYPLTGLFWPIASVIAILTQTSYGIGGVCLNSYLPYLAKRTVKRLKYGLDNDYAPIFTDEPEEGDDVDDNASFSHSETSSSSGDASDEVVDEKFSVQTQTARLSAYGQALGYASGIALLIVLLIPLNILSKSPHPPDNPVPPPIFARKIFTKRSPIVAIRACITFTGVLWALLAIPAITLIRKDTPTKQENENQLSYSQAIKEAWKRLYHTFQVREIKQLQSTYWFLLAWALLSDGFATITSTAILFAKTQLHMDSQQLLAITVLSPLAGALGSMSSPYIQKQLKWSNHRSLVAIVLAGLFVPFYGLLGFLPFFKNIGFGGFTTPEEMFGFAIYFGAIYGAFQSYARTVFSGLIPPGQEAHWFSIYAISSKSTSFIGSLLVGLLADKSSNIRSGFLAIAVLFLIPLPVLISKIRPAQGYVDARIYAQARS
ncbi:hypothetical protein E3Q23_02760 [Wallemia mellicola]|uniref:Autophagy-related protein n=1 Tax=Wallemia mellicola TaxID=1708541 RepID=A0A4T0QV16_9BASI|nr:hypothetical protein E3Q23_02760 [Wallemia mellicola]TIC28190.1 hypothetical protein E3Q10_03302 [Wallemia mellicola]TIC64074.1 hypothetical protein E3Q01_02966 [Wallemia mellicola]